MRKRGHTAEQQATDASLVARATVGELAAFAELYRRHVDAAWRVALAVTTNPDDAADAVSDAFTRVFQALPERLYAADHFLPYLLAAVRNAAIDVLRRGGRQQPSEAADDREWPALNSGPVDLLLADEDASMVARAFRSLPERWRSVLWLTEVEQIPPRDAAMLLGVSPNGVAQLAVRARAGLRERYLQAHLRQNDVRLGCRHTVDRLGAYAAGGLAPRDVAKVDQHLAGCDPCRTRLSDLQELAPALRRSVLPLPAGLAALALAKWELGSSTTAAASVAATSGASAPVGAGASGTAGVAGTSAPVAGGAGAGAVTASGSLVASMASAALLMAGVLGAGVIAERRGADRPPTGIAAPAATAGTSTSGAGARASADAAAGASGADGAASVDLTALTGQLGGLPEDLERLVGTDLEALGRGRVKVATEAAVLEVDVADRRQPCRDLRVLGVPVACAPPPSGGTAPPADGVVSAVEATGRAVEPPASAPSGLDLPD